MPLRVYCRVKDGNFKKKDIVIKNSIKNLIILM